MTNLRLQIDPGVIPSDKDIDLHFNEQLKELGLKVSTNNMKDYREIFRLLNVYLSFPSSELAVKHRNANQLGELDLKVKKQQINLRETYIRVENEICNCCGFFVQKEELSNCEQTIADVNSLGSSTVVFFQTFKNIAVLLLLMLITYSIFTFATNISVANSTSNNGSLDYLSISLGSKANSASTNEDAKTYYLASSWLGVAMLGIWLIVLILMKKRTKKIENEGRSYTSVSDFSVVIEKMPTGYSKEQVQAIMDEYLILVAPPDLEFRQLKIEKYNEAKPFYFNQDEFNDDQLEAAQKKVKVIKEEMMQWIAQRMQQQDFSSTVQYRQLRIHQLTQAYAKIQEKKQQLIDKIVKKIQEKNENTTTFVFITFQTVQQRDFFLSYNSNSPLSKLKRILPCVNNSYRFGAEHQDSKLRHLVIDSAPEPEDINWGNIGFDECESIWRKFVTGFATLVILGVSFVIVYGLSTVQKQNSRERFVSFLISLVISIINLVIIKVIQYMTVFEKVYTNNTFQISLAYKSILAQLLNSIFIPIIVCVYIKDNNVYGQSGLTEDIFILAITSSFFPPLVRLIDPYYIFTYLKYKYFNRPLSKLGLSQYELNFIAQKPEFQLGMQYIYLISNFLFTCFFVSLQPVIPCFSLLGIFFMYWIEKYALFSRSQRPIPGIDTISVAMHQLIYFGGIAYALGSLTWAIFLSNLTNDRFRGSMVANLIAVGVGVLIFLFPYEAFISYKDNSNLKKSYSDRRIYFPAEYDRLNPVTKREGVKEYRDFLLKKKQEIQGLSIPMQENIAAQLQQLTLNNTHKGHQRVGKNESADVALQLFINQTRNVVDPKLLRSFLLPQCGRDHNIDLYASNIQHVNRDFSNRNLNAVPDQVLNPNNLYDQRRSFQRNYSFADNFRNVYKSTLNLSNLGLNSNQQMEGSKHQPNLSPNLDPSHNRRGE